ncbi:hypothetical protein GCM10017687_71930 [Streptomyces echinatus]
MDEAGHRLLEGAAAGERGETAARLFEDRYIHGSTRDRVLEGLADACDLTALQKEVAARSSTGGSVTRGEETERGKGTDRTPALADYDEPVRDPVREGVRGRLQARPAATGRVRRADTANPAVRAAGREARVHRTPTAPVRRGAPAESRSSGARWGGGRCR